MIHRSSDLSIRSTHQKLQGVWNPNPPKVGDGFTVDGKLIEIRNHNLEDSAGTFHRYMAIVLNVTKARRREFDSAGVELDTQYSTEVLEKKGFLNVYGHTKQDDPLEVSVSQLRGDLKGVPHGTGNTVEFWASASLVKLADFHKDLNLRLKTYGNSHLVESITAEKPEQGANYRGEDVLNKWDSKIQNFKVDAPAPAPTSLEAPVDDDEW